MKPNPKAAHPADLPTREQALAELHLTAVQLPLRRVPSSTRGLLRDLPPPPPGREGWPWTVECAPKEAGSCPTISIVTPSFAQGRFLEACIRSVLLQNYPALEYVVIDGGSTDESAAIIEKYAPWLSYSRSAKDRGQGHAINLGFAPASGDLLGWINSDDFYLPGVLSAVAATAATANADFFYGDGLELDEHTGGLRYALAPYAHGRYRHFGGMLFSHSSFWRRAIHEPIWERMRCNVDGELWQRLLPGRRLRYIPRPLGVVRLHAETKTGNPGQKEAWLHDDRLIWDVHGRPPAARTWLRAEYRWVQNYMRQRRSRSRPAPQLQPSFWLEPNT